MFVAFLSFLKFLIFYDSLSHSKFYLLYLIFYSNSAGFGLHL